MESKVYDTPKPIKHKTGMKDRILKHPITSLVGVFLILCGIYVLKMDLEDATKLTVTGLLIGGGLISLGLKDKKPEE